MPLFRVTQDLVWEQSTLFASAGNIVEVEIRTDFRIELTLQPSGGVIVPAVQIGALAFFTDWADKLVPFQEDVETLSHQIDRLARFILENFPRDIQGGGAVDTAISIMGRLQDLHNLPKPLPPIDHETLPTLWQRLDV